MVNQISIIHILYALASETRSSNCTVLVKLNVYNNRSFSYNFDNEFLRRCWFKDCH